MKEVPGDIWDYYEQGHWIVITTNGNVKKNGAAVMGKGIALQAAERFPKLPLELGRLMGRGSPFWVFPFSEYRLFTFPTKYNWWEKSDVELIKRSVMRLKALSRFFSISPYPELNNVFPLYMTRPGCRNGGLDWKDVKPILERYLDDKYMIVEWR